MLFNAQYLSLYVSVECNCLHHPSYQAFALAAPSTSCRLRDQPDGPQHCCLPINTLANYIVTHSRSLEIKQTYMEKYDQGSTV